jgi:hypothetical protein
MGRESVSPGVRNRGTKWGRFGTKWGRFYFVSDNRQKGTVHASCDVRARGSMENFFHETFVPPQSGGIEEKMTKFTERLEENIE